MHKATSMCCSPHVNYAQDSFTNLLNWIQFHFMTFFFLHHRGHSLPLRRLLSEKHSSIDFPQLRPTALPLPCNKSDTAVTSQIRKPIGRYIRTWPRGCNDPFVLDVAMETSNKMRIGAIALFISHSFNFTWHMIHQVLALLVFVCSLSADTTFTSKL